MSDTNEKKPTTPPKKRRAFEELEKHLFGVLDDDGDSCSPVNDENDVEKPGEEK